LFSEFLPALRSRIWLLGGAAFAALVARCASPAPPDRTIEGLAGMLGRAVGGVVHPDDIAWEPSSGFWSDTFLGRRVLFLAAPSEGRPRDLHRARVRVSLEGKPIAVGQVRNLTLTPAGDDAALEVEGSTAVFTTVAYGQIQGVTVLDMAGIPETDLPPGLVDRLLLKLSSHQEAASTSGIGRVDIVLDVPVKQAQVTLAPPKLSIDVSDGARNLVYDLGTRTLVAAEGGQAYGAHAVARHHGSKPWLIWAVDTVRAEVGPDAVAWLENTVFGARDAVKRRAYALVTSSRESALKKDLAELVIPPALDASELAQQAPTWPPPTIPSLWETPKPGEGEWQPVEHAFLKTLPAPPGATPVPYFYQTILRPDPKRPYSELLLVAMDMRQLDLGMEAGYEDPKPATGSAGSGRLPRDPAILGRVVATFNGAFKSEHGQYGMMVDRRVIVPPVRGAASVVVDEEGKTGLGNWPHVDTIPKNLVSFRQNLDPLLEDGVVNPAGRYIWGWQLSGTSVMTQRTALCVTPAGHLYYAFAEEMDAPTLSRGLKQAGCTYALHLDMNPKHCGFVYTSITDLRSDQYRLKIADRRMEINADRFIRWSPKDFFYVMLRDPKPPAAGGFHWEPDGGTQPPPVFLPAVFASKLALGGLEIELLGIDQDRVGWRVRAGTLEPTSLDGAPKELELSGDDQHRVLAAIGLGHATGGTGLGLAFGPVPSLALRSDHASLLMRKHQGIVLRTPGEPWELARGDEAVELPLLAKDGELLVAGRATGGLRQRGALCVTSGRVLLARARHDSSAPLAAALLRAGCRNVVELDRGSQHPTFVHRAGSSTPPTGRYETSVLYALGRPMVPRTYRWMPPGSTKSTKPTLNDASPPKPSKAQAAAPSASR
jgi:hypothetical protein